MQSIWCLVINCSHRRLVWTGVKFQTQKLKQGREIDLGKLLFFGASFLQDKSIIFLAPRSLSCMLASRVVPHFFHAKKTSFWKELGCWFLSFHVRHLSFTALQFLCHDSVIYLLWVLDVVTLSCQMLSSSCYVGVAGYSEQYVNLVLSELWG
jgi:hypothetical protein